MKSIALYNPAAGSVPPDGGERLRAALDAVGVRDVDIVETDCSDRVGQMKQLASKDPDLFVVWGGDGTLRSALCVAGQKIQNLLLLPGGTMNLLPRAIHGEKTWDAVVRDVMTSPKRRTLSAGKVNGEMFYCAMLAGAPVRMAEAREALRRGELVKAATEARAALDTISNLNLDAHYSDGYSFGGGQLPATSIIGAIIGPLTKAGHGMEVAALASPTATGALNVMWTSFFSDWRNAPGVTVVPAHSLEVDSSDGDIPILVDGEAIDAGRTVRVSFVEEAAQCLTAA